MEARKQEKLSIETYLQMDSESSVRFEYHDGHVVSLAGGSLHHGLICGNVFGEMRSRLKAAGSSCTALSGEIRLHIPSENSFAYPDAMAVCGDMEKSPFGIEAITNPILVIEVLSKSTASYDRGDKFYLYRQIESLLEYVLIEQDKPLVEIYSKQPSALWKISRIQGLDSVLTLSSIGISIPLKEVYEGVVFEAE